MRYKTTCNAVLIFFLTVILFYFFFEVIIKDDKCDRIGNVEMPSCVIK